MESVPIKQVRLIDYNQCFICQIGGGHGTDYTNYILNPTLDSVSKVVDCAQLRFGFGETEFAELNLRITNVSAQFLLSKGISFHKRCYKDLTNKDKIERARTRLGKLQQHKDIDIVRRKRKGRPVTSSEEAETSSRPGRGQLFDNSKCVLCQECTQVSLHDVTTSNMGSQFKEIGLYSTDEDVKVRLSLLVAETDPLAAVAYDIKYHLPCFIKAKRNMGKSSDSKTPNQDISLLICNMKILDVVENHIQSPCEEGLNMNDIQITYMNILRDNSVTIQENPHYKPYLKQLIMDNVPDVHINKPVCKNQSEQVISTSVKEMVVSEAFQSDTVKDDLQVLLKASKIIRRDIFNAPVWEFKGTFDDYIPPALLYEFCKCTIQGTGQIQSERREASVCKSASILAQHFVQSIKSDRQSLYTPKNEESDFRNQRETPFAVGVALAIHTHTRSKSIISNLESLDLGISYTKLMAIENGIATYVKSQMDSTGGLCLPHWMVKGQFVWFALDNVDFLEATPSAMNTLHGTAIAVYQNKSSNDQSINHPKVEIKRTNVCNESSDNGYEILPCQTPQPKKSIYPCVLSTTNPIMDTKRVNDLAWILTCLSFNSDENSEKENSSESETTAAGTWGGFNSIVSPSGDRSNVSLVAPLIRSPPTDYGTLYTGLKRAQGITTHVMGPENITVITLDLQLYDMAMKLWVSNKDIQQQFLFRPGELHVVFWALAALGKYIEASGIDQALVEAGIYSATTVSQIIGGHHLYRAMEAHTVTLLALYQLYFNKFLTIEPQEKDILVQLSDKLISAYDTDTCMPPCEREALKKALSSAISLFASRDILSKLKQFESNASKIQKFIINYLRQFETILMFVRATRNKDFNLHLESTEALMKYFFAHDHLRYARLLPLYISNMQTTKLKHPEIWEEFVNGNFCVTKGFAGFTSVAPDHAIEHENRKLKVTGGIVGITQNESALCRFFLIAPELNRLVDDFEEEYSISNENTRRDHHEIKGRKLHRVLENATKMKNVIVDHGDPFSTTDDDLYNLLTKAVVNEKVTNEILQRDEIGQDMLESFVQERLVDGKLSVWDHMKRRNIGTFKTANAVLDVKVGDNIVKIKEERGLLQRFVIAARSRPDLDLKECIGTYEFGIIPRSLFAPDGMLLLAYDKAKILHQLEAMVSDSDGGDTLPDQEDVSSADSPTEHSKSVIIIDAMAVVNSIPKTSAIETCADFANQFINKVIQISSSFEEVRLVFDRYLENSLKEQMRLKRTKGKSTFYHIKDSTLIRNISLKDLLSDIKTKAELTEYLAKKTLDYGKLHGSKLQRLLVTSGTSTDGNFDVPDLLQRHNQEEADTILLLHAITVEKSSKVVIHSPDTDVFILMVYMYDKLPSNLLFQTGKGNTTRQIHVRPIYNKLGPRRASALLGFHSFTGSDLCGRFSGRTKQGCFKIFMTCDDEILTSLSALGSEEMLSSNTKASLERFVCMLFKSKTYTKVNELRWFLYSNRGLCGESLPPTLGSLEPHTLRAHYITMIWKRSCESDPCLPSPCNYGWIKDDSGHLMPVKCRNAPAPEVVINLIKCSCKKGCLKNCSCRKNKIPCTELCGCYEFDCNNYETCLNVIDDPESTE